MGLKSSRIKELNKFYLYKDAQTTSTKSYFEAFCEGNTSFSVASNSTPLSDVVNGSLLRTNLGKVAARSMGLSGGISMGRIAMYSGSQPATMTFNCWLETRGDYNKNVATPLNNLMDLILPEAKGADWISFWENTINKSKATNWLKEKAAPIYNALSTVGSWFKEFMEPDGKGIYTLSLPDQYDPKKVKALRIKCGALSLDGIYINSVSVAFPKVFMEDDNGKAVPDHVKVTLSVTTDRLLSRGNIQPIKF